MAPARKAGAAGRKASVKHTGKARHVNAGHSAASKGGRSGNHASHVSRHR